MPITKQDDGSYTITGYVLDQLNELNKKIKRHESIEEILDAIHPSNLDLMLNQEFAKWIDLAPVHFAAECGNLPALKELVKMGARLDVFSGECGESPLHFAARYNHIDIIEYLIKQHLDVNIRCKQVTRPIAPDTPLFTCARFGSVGAAQILINHGADVNYQSSNGVTAMHAACHDGLSYQDVVPERVILIVKLLLENGADPTLNGKCDPSSGWSKPSESMMYAQPKYQRKMKEIIDQSDQKNAPSPRGCDASTCFNAFPLLYK